MRNLLLLSAAVLALGMSSAAQAGPGKMSGRWCLVQAGVEEGSNCRFTSRRQCMASRTANADACTRSAGRRGMTMGQGMRY